MRSHGWRNAAGGSTRRRRGTAWGWRSRGTSSRATAGAWSSAARPRSADSWFPWPCRRTAACRADPRARPGTPISPRDSWRRARTDAADFPPNQDRNNRPRPRARPRARKKRRGARGERGVNQYLIRRMQVEGGARFDLGAQALGGALRDALGRHTALRHLGAAEDRVFRARPRDYRPARTDRLLPAPP